MVVFRIHIIKNLKKYIYSNCNETSLAGEWGNILQLLSHMLCPSGVILFCLPHMNEFYIKYKIVEEVWCPSILNFAFVIKGFRFRILDNEIHNLMFNDIKTHLNSSQSVVFQICFKLHALKFDGRVIIQDSRKKYI